MIRFGRWIVPFALIFSVALAHADSGPKQKKIAIKNLKYDPPKLTVKTGETVLWTNSDDNDHTVISDDEGQFESGNLGRGDTFKHTFEKAGKFAYHCKYHPRMKGVVV